MPADFSAKWPQVNYTIQQQASQLIAQTLPCYMVNNVTTNTDEQCKFMLDNDCFEDESTIDYAYLVYCDISHRFRYAAILLILFLVVVLFLNLSAVADEFLCPSLLTVAKNLRMSDSLAGVTLLAFGNGCPDIFSSLAAASSGRPEIIVGELLGAGIFCTSIVAGLIFIHSDFKLARRPLLRDATFYLLAVYLIWLYCYQGYITFYGSLAFIIIYVIYLLFALSGQAINSRLRGEYPIEEEREKEAPSDSPATTSSADASKQEELEYWLKWRAESLRRGSLVKLSDDECKSLANSTDQQQQQRKDRNSLVLTDDRTTIKISYLAGGSGNIMNGNAQTKCQLQQQQATSSDNVIPNERPQQEVDDQLKRDPLSFEEFLEFLAHVSPIHLDDWREAKFYGKLILILRAPLLLMSILTVPVVNNEKRNNNWNRLLNSIHCFMVPIAVMSFTGLGSPATDEDDIDGDDDKRLHYETLGTTNEFQSTSRFLDMRLLLVMPGLLLALFLIYSTSWRRAPKYHAFFSYIGFAMSVLWIFVLAKEIISILKTVGIIFSMTDTAIGLGVLAWGNSLGDIVANLTLAEAGYARMALGASIGAPLLNLLLGFGLSFTVSLEPGQSIQIEYTPTTSLLAITLALILILLMLSTIAPGNRSKRPFGYMLISFYGIYFALAVCLECGLIKF